MRTQDAITHFKTRIALAKALRITRGAISQWGEFVPPRRQHQLEKITNGVLKADDMPLASEDRAA